MTRPTIDCGSGEALWSQQCNISLGFIRVYSKATSLDLGKRVCVRSTIDLALARGVANPEPHITRFLEEVVEKEKKKNKTGSSSLPSYFAGEDF